MNLKQCARMAAPTCFRVLLGVVTLFFITGVMLAPWGLATYLPDTLLGKVIREQITGLGRQKFFAVYLVLLALVVLPLSIVFKYGDGSVWLKDAMDRWVKTPLGQKAGTTYKHPKRRPDEQDNV
jgi:hypothetical protein